jgi:hypothetical protein
MVFPRFSLFSGILAPALAFAAAAIYLTWPLAEQARDHIVGDITSYDTFLVLWILAWDIHALFHDPLNLFNANAFHPEKGVLARSEHLLGQLPLFAPLWMATRNTVLAFNCAALLSFVLAGLAMYVLVRRWTRSALAGWVAGFGFAFSPWRLPGDLKHGWLLQVQYLPLILLGLDRTLATGSFRTAAWTALVLALQALCSYYLGYAAFALVGVFVCVDLVLRGIRGRSRSFAALAIAVLPALAILVPLTLPYLRLSALGEITAPDPALQQEIYGALREPLLGLIFRPGAYAILALAGFALLGLPRVWRTRRATAFRIVVLLAIALVGAALARGPTPVADSGSSPFAWLAAVVPGFANVRAPRRIIVLFSLATSALAGFAVAAVDRVLVRRGHRLWARLPVPFLAIVAIVLPAGSASIRLVEAPVGTAVPPVYRFLAVKGGGEPLLELPMLDNTPPPSRARSMYFSTFHWLPIVNGYTGYNPSSYPFFVSHASQLPSPEALQLMVDCAHLRWIIVHWPKADRLETWRTLQGVREIGAFSRADEGEDWLFEVTARPASRCASGLDHDKTIEGNEIGALPPLNGSLRIDLPAEIGARLESEVQVTVGNTGESTWPCTAVRPRDRVGLTVAWDDIRSGKTVSSETILVPHDVGPGQRLAWSAWLKHPVHPGRYQLRAFVGQARSTTAPDATSRIRFTRTVDVRRG